MLLTEEPPVAKTPKKPAPKVKAKGAEAETPKWQSKPIIVQLRGSDEFKAVVEEMADFDGNTVAGLVDRALRSYAREIGFAKPLPKR